LKSRAASASVREQVDRLLESHREGRAALGEAFDRDDRCAEAAYRASTPTSWRVPTADLEADLARVEPAPGGAGLDVAWPLVCLLAERWVAAEPPPRSRTSAANLRLGRAASTASCLAGASSIRHAAPVLSSTASRQRFHPDRWPGRRAWLQFSSRARPRRARRCCVVAGFASSSLSVRSRMSARARSPSESEVTSASGGDRPRLDQALRSQRLVLLDHGRGMLFNAPRCVSPGRSPPRPLYAPMPNSANLKLVMSGPT